MRFDYALEDLLPRERARLVAFSLYRRGIGIALSAFGRRLFVDLGV